MPRAAPRLCTCGRIVPAGKRCECAIKRKADYDKRRPTASARGYDDKWREARSLYLKAHPRCVRCGGHAVVVDHIKPHRGNMSLFWDRNNWQAMCTSCHSRWKQREERNV